MRFSQEGLSRVLGDMGVGSLGQERDGGGGGGNWAAGVTWKEKSHLRVHLVGADWA